MMDIIDNKQDMNFQLYCLDSRTKTFYSIWEIQKLKPFQGYFCDYTMYFRIKNIATGLFLANDGKKLSLRESGNQRECHFKFNPRKKQDRNSEINNSSLVKIVSYLKEKKQVLQINQEEEEDLKYSIKIDKEPLSSSKMLWQLQPIETTTQQSASRIASLYPALMKFYTFFQNWGCQDEYSEIKLRNMKVYTYKQALNDESELAVDVKQFSDTFQNLKYFFQSGNLDYSFEQKQNILFEQKIVKLFILLAKLIDHKAYGTEFLDTWINDKQTKTQSGLFKAAVFRTNFTTLVIEKTPQYIARKYLKEPLRNIYELMFQFCENNSRVSNFLLQDVPFLSG